MLAEGRQSKDSKNPFLNALMTLHNPERLPTSNDACGYYPQGPLIDNELHASAIPLTDRKGFV